MIRRLRDEAREEGRLIDATQGRKTRSVIITDSNHVILSAIQSETIETVKLPFPIGFGNIEIVITANTITKKIPAFIFGPFIIIK